MERQYTSLADPAPHAPDDIQYVELIDDILPDGGMTGAPIDSATVHCYLTDSSGVRLTSSQVSVWIPAGWTRRAMGYTTLSALSGGGTVRGPVGQARYNPRRGGLEFLSLQFSFAFGQASAAAQFIAGGAGGGLVAQDYEAPSVGIVAGDGTTGNLKVTVPGTYLALAGISVQPGLTGAGTLATPPNATFGAAIAKNTNPFGGMTGPDAQSHFHCLTDPAGTPNWKITVAGTDYDLPPLSSAVGNLSIAKVMQLGVNDQVGLYVQCANNIEVLDANLILLLID